MTKKQFAEKWGWNIVNNAILSDLESLIATEIAKIKEQPQPEELKWSCTTFDMSRLVDQPQPALNPIEQAYHAFQPIRPKSWPKDEWVKKQGETESIDNKGRLWGSNWNFDTNPEEWELYTEPGQPAKPFDKERFEAMFRAVVANGDVASTEFFGCTIDLITKLDAYYASKEGGENG